MTDNNNKEKKNMATTKKAAAPAKAPVTAEHAQDIKTLLDELKTAASEYGLCAEYDEVMEDIVKKLNAPVAEKDWKRPKTHRAEVQVRGYVNVVDYKGSGWNQALRDNLNNHLREVVAEALRNYEPLKQLSKNPDTQIICTADSLGEGYVGSSLQYNY
jgi:hypothetical protein